ncbi:Maf family protein [Candidatus Aalborgicola defluviihabitans]|uniref:Maf family protein n=1 Tax=Candidatus Aalborgicola defluviihabitans TaxID=3386187 RepID=UPI001EB8B5D2|nr:septum formation inhibitor Maf [Burkholderiales bacterium]
MPGFIYLASQSPRRSQLLDQLGVRHELLLPDSSEDAESLEAVLRNEAPKTYVQRVTGLKLQAALQRLAQRKLPPAPVLCADTTVSLGSTLFGKPEDAADAKRMLRALSNRPHRVLTALGRHEGGGGTVSESWVTFSDLSDHEIDAYVATGEPMGKAGAYGVQGKAAAHIAHLSGSYSGIMGLPLFETAQALRSLGFAV